MSASSAPTLLLIDGHSLAFRSYYAFAKSRDGGLRTSTGIPTSVCYGFLRSFLDVVKAEKPAAIVVAFDKGDPTFRHEADATYKANRAETPEDFIPDVQNLQALLEAFQLPIVTHVGFEADDILGTLAQQGSQAGYQVKIVSGDRDLFQLVDQGRQITVLYLGGSYGKGSRSSPVVEYDPAGVQEKLGVPPTQVVDYKALCGDSSDNIPGVKGIGPKTAIQLLQEHGSLEGIYNALPSLKGTLRQKLEDQREAAFHSQYLARIVVDVPLEGDLEAYQLRGFDDRAVAPLLEKLELKEFSRQLSQLQELFAPPGSKVSIEATTEAILQTIPEQTDQTPGSEDEGDAGFWTAEETLAYQQQQRPVLAPQIIDSPKKLATLLQHLQTLTDPAVPTAWDTETTALDPRDAKLVGIGCCWGVGLDEMAYIPLGHRRGQNLSLQMALEGLRPILESDRYSKVLQNAKFDRLIFKHQGINLQGVVLDTLLASYVINPETSHSLDNLADRYLKIMPQSYKDLVPKGRTIADLDIPMVAQYCGMDVHVTFRLVPLLQRQLATLPDLENLLRSVELPLEPVLAAMEDQGIRIDVDYLHRFSGQLETDLQRIEQQAYTLAGETFNLGSPKQLSEILFEKLALSKKKSRKTKTGYSTDAAVLEKLQGDHPLIDAILEHRTLAKLKSTYVDALPNLVRSDTKRVHTDFNQAVTATGRLSSSNPNLQNIPIRTAFSRQIRQAFIPEPGWLMVTADYSQIELRILAHLSAEPVLLEAYRQGTDVHTLTTQLLLEKDTITPEERRLGKTINFGVIYGMGVQRFARATGVDLKAAKLFLDRFHDRYPQVFAYLKRMEQAAIAQGYVSTILGRRRYFNFTSSGLIALRGRDPQTIDPQALKSIGQNDAGLLRAAANAPIQGSSADIIKIAMVKLQPVLQSYRARLLLQVHDELVFEMPPDEWPVLEGEIRSTMASAVALQVPLEVEIHSGQNWMEAK
jgi:DNA polymerase-1